MNDSALSALLNIQMNAASIDAFDPEPAFLIWNKSGQRGKGIGGQESEVVRVANDLSSRCIQDGEEEEESDVEESNVEESNVEEGNVEEDDADDTV